MKILIFLSLGGASGQDEVCWKCDSMSYNDCAAFGEYTPCGLGEVRVTKIARNSNFWSKTPFFIKFSKNSTIVKFFQKIQQFSKNFQKILKISQKIKINKKSFKKK